MPLNEYLLNTNTSNLICHWCKILQLLCQYEHDSVCKFLESLESYRVEHCLRLCLEYGITDAAAFLYERVGDVGSALSLLLSSLNDKFIVLDAFIEKELCGAHLKHFNNVLETKEVCFLSDILFSVTIFRFIMIVLYT